MKTDHSLSLRLTARFDDLPRLGEFVSSGLLQISESVADSGIDIDVETLAGDLTLAIHETCANVIDHAYGAESDAFILVNLDADTAQRHVIATITDEGQHYNPQQLNWPPPQCWQSAGTGDEQIFTLGEVQMDDLETERGRGLYLITLLLDSVTYQPRSDKNCWTLVKHY